MPRPGRWMVTLRRVLAVALLGTVAWLLAVLTAQTSWQTAFAVGMALALLAAALLLQRRLGIPAYALVLMGASLSGALAFPAVLGKPTESSRDNGDSMGTV